MMTHIPALTRARIGAANRWQLFTMAVLAALVTGSVLAQAPAAPVGASPPSPEQLETLVGPIALYPDDLIAIILPAATNPLQVVQAERFL